MLDRSPYDVKSDCDQSGNCYDELRWGNLSLPEDSSGWIDVVIDLPINSCGDTEFFNEARVSLTDNTQLYPSFFPLYDPFQRSIQNGNNSTNDGISNTYDNMTTHGNDPDLTNNVFTTDPAIITG